jgi:hypothetical protein
MGSIPSLPALLPAPKNASRIDYNGRLEEPCHAGRGPLAALRRPGWVSHAALPTVPCGRDSGIGPSCNVQSRHSPRCFSQAWPCSPSQNPAPHCTQYRRVCRRRAKTRSQIQQSTHSPARIRSLTESSAITPLPDSDAPPTASPKGSARGHSNMSGVWGLETVLPHCVFGSVPHASPGPPLRKGFL